MKILYRFVDRLVFAAGVLIFLQLPHFIDQYTQRLGGFYDAEQQHLASYQDIADRHFNGDMDKLFDAFRKSGTKAMEETADELEKISGGVDELREGVETLENGSFLEQVGYMIMHTNMKIARGTFRAYTPGMPFSKEGVISGLIGGVIVSLLFNGVIRLVRIPIKKLKNNKKAPQVARA